MKRQLDWWIVLNCLVMAVLAGYVISKIESDFLLGCLMFVTFTALMGFLFVVTDTSIYKEDE